HAVRRFKVGWGLVMNRIQGQDFGRTMRERPDVAPEYLQAMARLHVALHQHEAPRLPSLKTRLDGEIREAGKKFGASFPAAALLKRLSDLPDGDRLCHGDFHFANVVGEPGNASIIDWPSARRGHPAADVCQSWLLMQRTDDGLADTYVDTYA